GSGLSVEPANIKADVGDILEFWFYAHNHSVVTSTAAKPCEPKTDNGFYSGFFPVAQTGVASVRSFFLPSFLPFFRHPRIFSRQVIFLFVCSLTLTGLS
ncbi:hypothetical protein OFM52_29810, partial [Escherichia coli]|nr:hypothetical protein [Escherichia coli]